MIALNPWQYVLTIIGWYLMLRCILFFKHNLNDFTKMKDEIDKLVYYPQSLRMLAIFVVAFIGAILVMVASR